MLDEPPYIRVFIYGSLLPGLSNHHVVAPHLQSIVPGTIAGTLVDFGPYPGLFRTGDLRSAGTVRGCWIEVTRIGLQKMDELEGFAGIEEENDYERVWVRDSNHPKMQGWVYVWRDNRGYPVVRGNYWPDYFAAK
ncbi:hypothetical protein GCM10010916_16100 [Paenibacillus abyssi]|uniref:Gamma-glutamylcyclotransferase AIG2-like domain-containing protein n=2 Tax=Paenibacillus abyssi TaxID=1340531 RepID=A0A917CVG4_9BACL|nr:hypothetical protein GCM10010916_16100 [Paenibacillus abyssi]